MEKKASLAQLGAGFIQPFAGGTAMAGRAAKGSPERNGQAQRLSLKRWYETVTISKQLDSDRRAAYVPDVGLVGQDEIFTHIFRSTSADALQHTI